MATAQFLFTFDFMNTIICFAGVPKEESLLWYTIEGSKNAKIAKWEMITAFI